jgi:hypothetical protein
MRIVLLINATLDLIQARAALEGLPFECTATLRVGRSVDKGHLPAALRADKPIINTDGVWLFRGHNSSRNFQDGSAIVSQPPDAQREASLQQCFNVSSMGPGVHASN